MREGRSLAALMCVVAVVASAQVSRAEGPALEVDTDLALQTTYVFRGVPQYITDETTSLQLGGQGGVEGDSGRWDFSLRVASSLQERKANAQIGSADEFVPQISATWYAHPTVSWSFGVVDYIRPHSDDLNFRAEAFTRVDWLALDHERVKMFPFVAVYGEFLSLLGAFVGLGVVTQVDLGEGFSLDSVVQGGASQYLREGERFNFASLEVALSFTAPSLERLLVSGFVSTSVTESAIQVSTDFLERHNVTWSGLRIGYRALP